MITDNTLEYLLELDAIDIVVDEILGLWVKFEVKEVAKTDYRPHGIKYSLSLHDRFNNRLMGFDNAHAIDRISSKNPFDHWHTNFSQKIKMYVYKDAATLLTDFWTEVDKVIAKMREEYK